MMKNKFLYCLAPVLTPILMLLLVDDSETALSLFTGPLALELHTEVHPLLHEGSSAAELVQQMITMKPEWILLDGNLASGVQGPELVPPLVDAGIKVIGFSSAEWMREEFLHAGAVAFVHKKSEDVPGTVQEVAKAIANH